MAQAKFQTAILKPLTGLFDNRSSADEKPPGSFAWKENFAINPSGQLCRALGWIRPYESPCYRNHDFHDQKVVVANREPVTMLFQSTSNEGLRRLFGATKTRIILLDESAGDWTVIGSGLGADGEASLTQLRFNAAELQNKVVFTNDYDIPQIHTLGTLSVSPILDLAVSSEEAGAITKARRTVSWQGVVFLMNTEEDGIRYSSRIRWSDLNDATKWNPTTVGSLADYQDLDYNEQILNAMPMSGSLYVFTDKSIWRCSFVVNASDPDHPTAELNCVKVYTEPRNRAKCLSYENSLISTGFSFYYLGSDGAYEFSPYLAEPDRIEWLHRSTAVIFKNAATRIDKQACFSPIAEYVPGPNEDETAGSGEIHFSWPVYDPLATEVPADNEVTCAEYVPLPPVVGSGINRHTLVANVKFKTADYRNYGSTAMANFTSSQLASTGCNRQSVLFAANGADYCIKQMDTGSSRIMFNAETNEFVTNGYYSRAVGVFPFERFQDEKEVENFLVEFTPDDPNDTAVLRLRIGTTATAIDPMGVNGSCRVLWHQLSNKPVKCKYTKSASSYVTNNVRPDDETVWNFLYRGKFLYYDITIAAADNSAPTTGLLSMSRFEVSVKQVVGK